MIKGRENIQRHFNSQGLPVWKLYSAVSKTEGKPDLIAMVKESNSVEVGWGKLSETLDTLEPGIYTLNLAPSWLPADTSKHQKVAIMIGGGGEGTAKQPNQPVHQPTDHIGIFGVTPMDLIDLKVENARLKWEIEQSKKGEAISASTKAWLAMAQTLSPHLPAVIGAITKQPVAPVAQTTKQPVQQNSKPQLQQQQPAQQGGATHEQMQIAQSLQGIHENVEDTAGLIQNVQTITANLPDAETAISKLARIAAADPDALASVMPMLDSFLPQDED